MRVNAHSHVGYSWVSGNTEFPEQLIRKMDENGIDISLVQALYSEKHWRNAHDEIAEFAAKYPGRIKGVVYMSPNMDEKEYREEAERCITKLGFVGIKLNPVEHACNPLSRNGDIVFRVATEFNVPVLVHTGSGLPFGAPSLLIPVARRYPKTSIIICHAGTLAVADEAFVAAAECDNIYLEPSWAPGFVIRNMIRKFGAHRVMMGADHADNISVELTKVKEMELTKDEEEAYLGGTAVKVFRL